MADTHAGATEPGAEGDDKRTAYLEQLAHTLILRDWYAAVATPPGGPPFLRVTNPEATQMSDKVFCVLAADGTWEYVWRWGVRVGPADDLPSAVERVMRVLGAGS